MADETTPTTDADDETMTEAPSDNTTLVAVLDEMGADGYDADFGAREGGRLQCSSCREESAVADFRVDETRRMEGASDPDAEVLVVAATCPACEARGTAVFGYGPEASAVDAEALAAIDAADLRND